MCPSWFVVQTQPQAESKAARHLINQGFMAYLPFYRRRVRHARRNEILARPLFPGYLFVQLDPDQQRWRSINGTIGVRCILAEGGRPRSIPDRVVDEIVARQDETGAVKLTSPAFAPGQAVRLLAGPLTEVTALFEEARDDNRVILLLSLLGRKVRALASVDEVIAAA